jgi:hypothetical protein
LKSRQDDKTNESSGMSSEVTGHNPEGDPTRKSIEVDFALVLSRMIDTVKADPAQLRRIVYELARTKLQEDFREGNIGEAKVMASALEIAIKGVENFSRRQEVLSPPPNDYRSIGIRGSDFNALHSSPPLDNTATFIENVEPIVTPSNKWLQLKSITVLSCLGVAVGIVGLISYASLGKRLSFSILQNPSTAVTEQRTVPAAPRMALPSEGDTQGGVGQKPMLSASGTPSSSLPLPTSYGVYAVSNGVLSELSTLPGRVPDRRIAISPTIDAPSRTTLHDGRISFILFRRDLATSAPERLEVRIIARITRALTVDKAGKARTNPVEDVWSIRNISYDFRIAPLPENSEMLVGRSDTLDFVLPAGRYALVIKSQAYDFTIAGPVDDAKQCLERIDAANGSFYAECRRK